MSALLQLLQWTNSISSHDQTRGATRSSWKIFTAVSGPKYDGKYLHDLLKESLGETKWHETLSLGLTVFGGVFKKFYYSRVFIIYFRIFLENILGYLIVEEFLEYILEYFFNIKKNLDYFLE